MKPTILGILALGLLTSCGKADTDYECIVTCTVSGTSHVATPIQETEANESDATSACQLEAQTTLMSTCGSTSATVSCMCDASD